MFKVRIKVFDVTETGGGVGQSLIVILIIIHHCYVHHFRSINLKTLLFITNIFYFTFWWSFHRKLWKDLFRFQNPLKLKEFQ